jgi:hypothetical protein
MSDDSSWIGVTFMFIVVVIGITMCCVSDQKTNRARIKTEARIKALECENAALRRAAAVPQ